MAQTLRISKKWLAGNLHLAIITIAGLSTILRPSIESKVTLFRVLLPFLFCWLFVTNTRRALKLSLIISVFLVYSFIVSSLGRFHTFNITFNLYYITLFFFYFYYKEILKIIGAVRIYDYLSVLFKILIILGLIQLLFGGVYVNTISRYPAVHIFFWTENEYSAVLAIFVPLYFLREKGLLKFIWISLAIFLIAYDDAKLALLSLIVFFGGYGLMTLKIFNLKYLGFIVLGFIGALVLFFLRNYSVHGIYTVEYIISRLLNNLITQQPLEHLGTFNARSNAVILGVKEFVNSFLLGIGPGNSVKMMKEIVVPGTEEFTALSMHNFTLQLVTEMGIFGLAMHYIFFRKVELAALKSKYSLNLVFVFFVSCVISITLLSGAWANYFYLFILVYSIDFFKHNV